MCGVYKEMRVKSSHSSNGEILQSLNANIFEYRIVKARSPVYKYLA